MTKHNLKDAISALKAALQHAGDYGRLDVGGEKELRSANARLAIPEALRYLYRYANPVDFELPWLVEWLSLYPVEELEISQDGYRFTSGDPSQVDPGWRTEWVVIGDVSGDPIIVDTRFPDSLVLLATHGVGDWSPLRVSPSLSDFLLVLAKWLNLLKIRGGALRNDEGVLEPEVRTALENDVLSHLPEEQRKNFMSFVG